MDVLFMQVFTVLVIYSHLIATDTKAVKTHFSYRPVQKRHGHESRGVTGHLLRYSSDLPENSQYSSSILQRESKRFVVKFFLWPP